MSVFGDSGPTKSDLQYALGVKLEFSTDLRENMDLYRLNTSMN